MQFICYYGDIFVLNSFERVYVIKTKSIYNTTLEIFREAELNGITTNEAALNIAKNRILKNK